MNKLEKINKLVEKIKCYAERISDVYENIDIDLDDNCMEDGDIFTRLEIDKNSIRFEIDKNGEFYIETSLNNFESLDELTFWETMYIVSNHQEMMRKN
ncbi:hypothetical protein A2U03_06715 [Fusobacterium necrophorum subsp. funduliforme]|uniref:hypothetical protein n=1 Tax=Fusobacterium necrophorum TaxID=859 RepID=UPI000787BC10|nr:hypothetical protein [Fusobacterium necrophorum]KYM39599.1 hypothetical protein A2U03_06715 [Fusobacterium necrophorum subsp. funduliforme]